MLEHTIKLPGTSISFAVVLALILLLTGSGQLQGAVIADRSPNAFLPHLSQMSHYGPGSILRYHDTWTLPASWREKTWELRIRSGSTEVFVPIYHRQGGVNRSLITAYDSGLFLSTAARRVEVTTDPLVTADLPPGVYAVDITADGLFEESLGSFTLASSQCILLSGNGELGNTTFTFVGDANEWQPGWGLSLSEWESYLFSEGLPIDTLLRYLADPVMDAYRDRVNMRAVRGLSNLACNGVGNLLSCDLSFASLVVKNVCPAGTSFDPTVVAVAHTASSTQIARTSPWDPGLNLSLADLKALFTVGGIFANDDPAEFDRMAVRWDLPAENVLQLLAPLFAQLPFVDNTNCATSYPSRMCAAPLPFTAHLPSVDKATVSALFNRDSCGITSLQLTSPFPNGTASPYCTSAGFYATYGSPTDSPCLVNFTIVNTKGQTVRTLTTFEPVPQNPIAARNPNERVPYVMGYPATVTGSFWPDECRADPNHCSKAPGWDGRDQNGVPVATGTYYIWAWVNSGAKTKSVSFTYYNHIGTAQCLPPGATENGFFDDSPEPVVSFEDEARGNLLAPSFEGSACVGVDYLRIDLGLSSATCQAYCSHIGRTCAESCTTNRNFPSWGVEAWSTTAQCEGYATSGGQARCTTDLAAFSAHDRRKYRCCCI